MDHSELTVDPGTESTHPSPTQLHPRSARAEGARTAILMISGGMLVFAVAIAMAFSQDLLGPDFVRVAQRVERAGFDPVALTLLGWVLFGMGLTIRFVTRQTQLAGRDEETVRELAGLNHGFTALQERSTEVARVVDAIRESNNMLKLTMDEVTETARNGEEQGRVRAQEHKDAIFSLAASLDKFAAHMDKRLADHTANLGTLLGQGATAGTGLGRAELEASLGPMSERLDFVIRTLSEFEGHPRETHADDKTDSELSGLQLLDSLDENHQNSAEPARNDPEPEPALDFEAELAGCESLTVDEPEVVSAPARPTPPPIQRQTPPGPDIWDNAGTQPQPRAPQLPITPPGTMGPGPSSESPPSIQHGFTHDPQQPRRGEGGLPLGG